MSNRAGTFRYDRIKLRRESLGLTQEELAKRIGVGTNVIYRYETRQMEPNSGTLAKLADELAVSSDWLLDRTDDMGGFYHLEDLSPEEAKLIELLRRKDPVGNFSRAMTSLLAEQK